MLETRMPWQDSNGKWYGDDYEFPDGYEDDPDAPILDAPEYPRVQPIIGGIVPDMIDFRVSDTWQDYYYARGMTPFSSGRMTRRKDQEGERRAS